MFHDIHACEERAVPSLQTIDSMEALVAWENAFLGRKGELASLMKTMADRSAKDRPAFGQAMNELKHLLETAFASKKQALDERFWRSKLRDEHEDITRPGRRPIVGHTHIVEQAIADITRVFEEAGFARARHPEVDGDFYAFESLNMPKDHPARDEWETFFCDTPADATIGKIVLTPHTSNAQVRELEKGIFPVRMINIGKCYRRQIDATHVPMFHQFEGLFVDKKVSITHLLGILDFFAKRFFGAERRTRLRPFHFRFTEPSFEIDISCALCNGTGLQQGEKCRVCKRGWLELGGAGMVHPNVLKAGGCDPNVYQGFAFGWGVERTYLMKEGMNIDDIRTLYKNDVRFLEQF